MATPLIDLTTLTEEERPSVRIDGVDYPFRRVEELPVLSHEYVIANARRFDAIQQRIAAGEEFSEEEEREVSERFRRILRLVLMAPSTVLDRLSDLQVMGVFTAFGQLLSTSRQSPGVRTPTATSSTTGASSRRRSPRSTAATPGAGSTTSPSRSSARAS